MRHHATPPSVAVELLAHVLPADDRDGIIGDLAELYVLRVEAGRRFPRLWFWLQTILFTLRFAAVRRRGTGERERHWRMPMDVLSSLRMIPRLFRRDPGYALAFIVTLGLGIGATTAVFSAVDGVLFRALPYPHADRIMFMQQPVTAPEQDNAKFSFVEIADYRAQSHLVDEFVEYGDWQFNVVGLGDPQLVYGGLVTSNYFKVLAIRPLAGRVLTPDDDGKAGPAVAVLTFEFWRRLGQDPSVVGKTIELSGIPTTIVGVLEPGSHYASRKRADLYANYAANAHYMGAAMQNQRQHRMTDVYALVKAGVPLDAARSEIETISDRLHAAYPKDYSKAMRVTLTPWREVLVKNARPTLLILMAAVALVLVVACANVGNLSLARLTRREKELAVRAALGASALRLRTELLTEHLALAFAGSALGLGLASVMLTVLVDYTARLTLRADAVELNGVVLVFSLVIGAAAAVVFAWVPRLPGGDGSGSQLAGAAGGGRLTMSQRQRRIQRVLVVLQVGVSFVVLVGAGLLIRTFANLQAIAPGFDPTNVVSLRAPNVTGLNAARSRALFGEVTSRLRVYPGVVSVATTSRAPFEAGEVFPVFVKAQGSGLTGSTAPVQMLALTVSPDYFDTLEIRLRRGRLFGPQDAARGQRVAVINETLARLAFSQADPIGRTIDWNEMEDALTTPRTIVGVVSDVHEVGGSGTTLPTAYESSVQAAPGTALLIRTAGDPALVTREATAIIHRLDPKRPVLDATTLESASADRIAPSRLNATLFSGFAVLALSIAAVGIWGVLAFSVTQRTREFGIRMALGSGRGRILEGVLAEGLTLAGSGLAIGTVGATLMVRQLQAMLFDVAALDLRTFEAVGVLLAAVAALASLVPAMRATRVDPNVALRIE